MRIDGTGSSGASGVGRPEDEARTGPASCRERAEADRPGARVAARRAEVDWIARGLARP